VAGNRGKDWERRAGKGQKGEGRAGITPYHQVLDPPLTTGWWCIVVALMVVTSVSLFAGYSVKTGELVPESEPDGQGARLDWAFFVGVGGAAAALVAGVLFYCDGCRLAKIYQSYEPPTVAVRP